MLGSRGGGGGGGRRGRRKKAKMGKGNDRMIKGDVRFENRGKTYAAVRDARWDQSRFGS